jgi:hypothetical protein
MPVVGNTLEEVPFESSRHAGRGCRRKALPTSLPALGSELVMRVIFETVDWVWMPVCCRLFPVEVYIKLEEVC